MTQESVHEALVRLADRLWPGASIDGATRLSGGATQETWSFDVVQGEERRGFILRRRAQGKRVQTEGMGLSDEARVIAIVREAGVPAPEVEYVLSTEDGLGDGFIMHRIEGETIPARILREPRFGSARQVMARQCGEILARIHRVKIEALPPLGAFDADSEVDRLTRSVETGANPRPVFVLALRWLRQNRPVEEGRRVLTHGDFRMGNLMIGEEGIRAVLDWELARIGDPMSDLAWLCVPSWRFGRIDQPVGGVGAREDLFVAYEAASGKRVDRAAVRFWEVVGALRWGLICESNLAALRNEQPISVERAVIARRSSETEIDLLRYMAGLE